MLIELGLNRIKMTETRPIAWLEYVPSRDIRSQMFLFDCKI